MVVAGIEGCAEFETEGGYGDVAFFCEAMEGSDAEPVGEAGVDAVFEKPSCVLRSGCAREGDLFEDAGLVAEGKFNDGPVFDGEVEVDQGAGVGLQSGFDVGGVLFVADHFEAEFSAMVSE